MTDVDQAARTLQVAQEVAAELESRGIPCAVIGAMALAAHNYPRSTDDFDLATDVDPFRVLKPVADALRARGYEVELVTPDAEDPLGGVLNITGDDFNLVQVVNFDNPFSGRRTPAAAAIQGATLPLGDTRLRVVSLPDLVALKLYAGGPKAASDIAELLARNQPLDLVKLREVCAAARLLPELEKVLRDNGLA